MNDKDANALMLCEEMERLNKRGAPGPWTVSGNQLWSRNARLGDFYQYQPSGPSASLDNALVCAYLRNFSEDMAAHVRRLRNERDTARLAGALLGAALLLAAAWRWLLP